MTVHSPSINWPLYFNSYLQDRLPVYCAVAWRNHLQSCQWWHGLGRVASPACVNQTRSHKAIKMEKTQYRFLATRQSVHSCSPLLCLWIRLHAVNYLHKLIGVQGEGADRKPVKSNHISPQQQCKSNLSLPASHHTGTGSIPGQSMWDLLWTKGHWNRFFPEYVGVPLSISFHQCSITCKNERTNHLSLHLHHRVAQ
jgi:hypothetical protein